MTKHCFSSLSALIVAALYDVARENTGEENKAFLTG
jgi:hypothetical protein